MKKALRRIILAIFMLVMAVPGNAETGTDTVRHIANRAHVSSQETAGGLRIHVIGSTDLEGDQQFKLIVRDIALEYIGSGNAGSVQPDTLAAYLNAHAVIAGHGESIRVQRGIFRHPASVSGDMYWPAGRYDTLRIIIGRGEGRNWWGMLFGGQCIHEPDVEYYSVIAEWLLRLFGSDRQNTAHT